MVWVIDKSSIYQSPIHCQRWLDIIERKGLEAVL